MCFCLYVFYIHIWRSFIYFSIRSIFSTILFFWTSDLRVSLYLTDNFFPVFLWLRNFSLSYFFFLQFSFVSLYSSLSSPPFILRCITSSQTIALHNLHISTNLFLFLTAWSWVQNFHLSVASSCLSNRVTLAFLCFLSCFSLHFFSSSFCLFFLSLLSLYPISLPPTSFLSLRFVLSRFLSSILLHIPSYPLLLPPFSPSLPSINALLSFSNLFTFS